MAFITVPSSAGGDGANRLPILKYDARAGRIFLINRLETADGWVLQDTDITMQAPVFAVDFGSLEVGWQHFSAGVAPMMFMAPYGQPVPAKPPSPGNDAKGKPQQFKQGFRLKVAGQAIGGVREFCANANAILNGMNELHSAYEKAPEAAAGKIPLVRLVNSIPVKTGQSTNYQPVFDITGWADRPAALGPRTVPSPAPAGGVVQQTAPIAYSNPQQVALQPVQQPVQAAQPVQFAPAAPVQQAGYIVPAGVVVPDSMPF